MPGAVQVESSEKVRATTIDPITGERKDVGHDLETTMNHVNIEKKVKGAPPTTRPDGHVPVRTKYRHVFHTRGKPLKERRSVKQILLSIYDSLQGEFVVWV